MTHRGTVDPTRQGASNLGSLRATKERTFSPVTATDHADLQRWRKIRPASIQAEIALADALARAIGCQKADWRDCQQHPWTSCCVARLRACEEEPAT
jgi:hypothetical protein